MTYQKYKFRKYDSKYPKLFEKEKTKIIEVLSKNIVIEHVGSTAVPGLGGKGIIDIAIFTSRKDVKKQAERLEKIGFKFNLKHKADDRRWFMQKIIINKGKERRIHLHLCLTKKFWDSFIDFRNYLVNHDDLRYEYARIKKEGAKHAKGEGKKYREYKERFLVKINKKALKWKEGI